MNFVRVYPFHRFWPGSLEPTAMQDLLAKFANQLSTQPYPCYHVIRRLDPVHWSDSWQSWFLTRYQDVALVMKDVRFRVGQVEHFSKRLDLERLDPEQRRVSSASLAVIERWLASFLLFTDPPEHTRLRALISKAFTPRSLEQIEPLIERRVEGLLADFREGQVVDLIPTLAVPLPVMTIADFLGSRADDHEMLGGWSHDLASFLGNDRLTPEVVERSRNSLEAMAEYFGQLMDVRQREPQEDLMSRLLLSQHEGSSLTHQEVLSMCILLFGAGHDTTTNLIGNGLLTLLRHPQALPLLQREPDRVLEEVLRYDNPSLIASRTAAEAVELGGRQIQAGDCVNLCVGAANRDPAQFAEPDRFWPERPQPGNLSFGRGIHFCVGSFLAKLEARILLTRFFGRWPGSRIVVEPERIPTLAFRRLRHLQVELRA